MPCSWRLTTAVVLSVACRPAASERAEMTARPEPAEAGARYLLADFRARATVQPPVELRVGPGPPWCLPDTGRTARFLLTRVREGSLGGLEWPDSLAAERSAFAQPVTGVDRGSFERDEASCQRASAVLGAQFHPAIQGWPVWLVRRGGNWPRRQPTCDGGSFTCSSRSIPRSGCGTMCEPGSVAV